VRRRVFWFYRHLCCEFYRSLVRVYLGTVALQHLLLVSFFFFLTPSKFYKRPSFYINISLRERERKHSQKRKKKRVRPKRAQRSKAAFILNWCEQGPVHTTDWVPRDSGEGKKISLRTSAHVAQTSFPNIFSDQVKREEMFKMNLFRQT